jgi:hypothetical protein
MNAIVVDRDVLHSIGHLDVAAYLRNHGWRVSGLIGVRGAVFETDADRHRNIPNIILPLDRNLGDYDTRMGEILAVLEAAESRSQLEILHDISDASADVIRIRLQNASLNDGSFSLDKASNVIASAREMMSYVACSVAQPRLVYRSRKPATVTNYLSKLRLGQTERGSYVLALRSIVPPRFSSPQQPTLFPDMPSPDEEEPFERRVTIRLAQALTATNNALVQSSATSDVKPFEDGYVNGVSANLCEALAGLTFDDAPLDIQISVNWASTRAISRNIPGEFSFSSESLLLLREVGRVLRANAPYGPFELRGPVVKLERDEGSLVGQITAMCVIDRRYRHVVVELNHDDYEIAIQAHRLEVPVICEGELVKEGNSFRLQNPNNLALDIETTSPI